MSTGRDVVLIVDDEENVAEVFALWLEDDYDVRVATSGEEALELLDEAVGAILLDRRMPGLSGDEVLEEIRRRGLDVPVAMVTAVDPDFDILDMAFDDYLTKPVENDELTGTIERLLTLAEYDDHSQEHFALAKKLATLEAEKTDEELAASDEYQSLLAELSELRDEMDEMVSKLDEKTSTMLFKGLDADEE